MAMFGCLRRFRGVATIFCLVDVVASGETERKRCVIAAAGVNCALCVAVMWLGSLQSSEARHTDPCFRVAMFALQMSHLISHQKRCKRNVKLNAQAQAGRPLLPQAQRNTAPKGLLSRVRLRGSRVRDTYTSSVVGLFVIMISFSRSIKALLASCVVSVHTVRRRTPDHVAVLSQCCGPLPNICSGR
jgi:hypothetical protein